MKRILFLLFFCPLLNAAKEPFFKNEIIHKLDCIDIGGGKTIGINGETISQVMKLANDIRIIQVGAKDSQTNTVVKNYQCGGQDVTLRDLVQYEETLETELEKQRTLCVRTYGENTPAFNNAWETIQHKHAQKKEEVAKALHVIKDDFLKKTEVFMDQVRMFKSLLCDLIKEWIQRRECPESLLVTWANVEGNDEYTYFHANFKKASDVDTFLTHLKIFLMDLVHSCPKGMKDFQENFAVKK